jgi:hypothetical protein
MHAPDNSILWRSRPVVTVPAKCRHVSVRGENILARDKWVKVMADFSAVGIWQKSGSMAMLEDLEDAHAVFMLGGWQNWYEMRHSDDPIQGIDKFVRYGWNIVWEIACQNPDWTVVYFDEKHHESLIGIKLWLRFK